MKSAKRDRIFLVHWNLEEAEQLAAPLRSEGWQVELEAEDGARAYRRICEDPPSAIVIYLTRLPSHGRETAHALRQRSSLASLPIILVGGKPGKVEKVRERVPAASYLEQDELIPALAGLPGAGS